MSIGDSISWHFQLNLATAPQARLFFISRKLNFYLALLFPYSTYRFSSIFLSNSAVSHLFVNIVFSYK